MRSLSGPILTAAEMKAAEIASGVPLDELMERAGTALADAAMRFGAGHPVLVLCGPGNNGGDGYVAARVLVERGVPVQVAACDTPKTDLARAARKRWTGSVVPLGEATPARVVIDALFGTGLSRHLDEPHDETLWMLWSFADLTIAADLPSGVGADDGVFLGAAPCDLTIAFGAAKPAHLLHPAAAKCGRVLIADIGIPVASAAHVLSRPGLGAPTESDHKYTRGMVAVVAGEMGGAATLGVSAAAYVAGYTVLCGKGDAPAAVVRRGFAATLGDPKLGAMLVGPGLADTAENRTKLDMVLASAVPLVLDAGALGLVEPEQFKRAAATIVTPHEGEFVRLFGELDGSKLDRARAASARSNATVVLKGSDTVIASPDGRATISPTASPWLASAGTGDVLAGLIAGLLSGRRDPHEAACAAVWLHAEAARCAGPGLIADTLLGQIPAALAAVTR